MSAQPWMKFYPRDWRGDQALRVVSLAARGLWMEMLCIMHEASPYGHLLVAAHPVKDDALARLVGTSVEEVQALLVELGAAGVFRRTRGGVIYSKRMIDDNKRSIEGRKAKLEALEKDKENPGPSRPPKRPPTTQKPDTRAKVEGGTSSPSTLSQREGADERADGSSPPRARPDLKLVSGPDPERSSIEGMTVDEIRAAIFAEAEAMARAAEKATA